MPCTTCDQNDHPRIGDPGTAQDAAVDLHRALHEFILAVGAPLAPVVNWLSRAVARIGSRGGA